MEITKIKVVTAVFSRDVSGAIKHASPRYSYFVPEGDEPKIGDMIVTSVSWGDPDSSSEFLDDDDEDTRLSASQLRRVAETAKIARIVSVCDTTDSRAKKFYLKLLPISELRECQIRNREFLQRYADAEDAMNKLEELLKKQNRLDAFAALAASNPEAAALLAKIKDI